ncbi:MAG: hypothetical protein ACT4OI_00285 [Methanobacteriota archaeon]
MKPLEAKQVCECLYLGVKLDGMRPAVHPNVVGVGLGHKLARGTLTRDLALRFYVRQKLHHLLVREEDRLPPEIEGVPTDVVESREFSIWRPIPPIYHRKVRPAMGGLSIGHYEVTAGTFGCLVKDRRERYVLSNNHVLANENRGMEGDPILQPGRFDGGKLERDVLGRLVTYVALDPDGLNVVDAALAEPHNPDDVTPDVLNIGRLQGTREPELGESVRKSGRTTRLTEGVVEDASATIRVGYSQGSFVFTDQVIVRGRSGAFSAGGDSGAVVVGQDDKAIGLLFGGSPFFTVANKMAHVEKALDVAVA